MNILLQKNSCHKVYIFWEGQIWRNLPVDLSLTKQKTNQLGDFVKFLWPSQNILILIGRVLVVMTQKVHTLVFRMKWILKSYSNFQCMSYDVKWRLYALIIILTCLTGSNKLTTAKHKRFFYDKLKEQEVELHAIQGFVLNFFVKDTY